MIKKTIFCSIFFLNLLRIRMTKMLRNDRVNLSSLLKEDIMTDKIKYLNDENFQEIISKGVTLVDFYADWCGPCRMIAPIIEELAEDLKGKATIAKLDIESAQATTANFQVTSIPTIILFKDGKEVKRIVGLRDKDALKSLITAEL
jgi:thioredoxin 1